MYPFMRIYIYTYIYMCVIMCMNFPFLFGGLFIYVLYLQVLSCASPEEARSSSRNAKILAQIVQIDGGYSLQTF